MPKKFPQIPTANSLDDKAEKHIQDKGIDSLDFEVTVNPPKERETEILDNSEFALANKENPVVEKLDNGLAEEFELDLAGMAGNIIESKPLDHNLLAKVMIEKNNLGNHEGIYLILKIQGESPIIFGNKHADKLDKVTINIAYQAINSTEQFLEMGAEYGEGVDMEQQTRLEKLRKELFTISGIIKKYRFLGHNLLALIKIDKRLQEMAFGEEKTDPKRIRMALSKNGAQIDCVENLRDGIYAVLSKGGVGMKILGGKSAYMLDPEIAETIYESIQNPAHFFNADNKLKQYIKGLEEDVDKEIEAKTHELDQIISKLDEPITEEGEASEITEEQIDEELNRLTVEIDDLKNKNSDK